MVHDAKSANGNFKNRVIGLSSAIVLASVALLYLDGTLQWVIIGLAGIEAVFLSRIL